jgi:hypothetical protein
MATERTPREDRDPPVLSALIVLLAAAVAGLSACRAAGGWNDGSRLATVECLVDHGTLAIDRSVYLRFVPAENPGTPPPYQDPSPAYQECGTGDKLLINGHYYSDKSPVPALLLAGSYRALQAVTGLIAREDPGRFCWWMTLGSSGLAYVLAVWCVFRLGLVLGLTRPFCLALTASFALATVALPYVRYVNNHELLLAVAAALFLNMARLPQDLQAGRTPWLRLVGIGLLAGLGYAIDLGAGPVLFAGTALLLAWRCRRVRPVAVFVLAALPAIVLHHAVNYAVGGTLKPANAVPEYLQWPGSGFTAQNMTGVWNDRGPGERALYAVGLLLGKRGFFWHNLPLLLAAAAAVPLLRKRLPERPELLLAVFWSGGTWLAYGLTSSNASGVCCSVRWFVPLVAPGFYMLAVLLRERPSVLGDLLLLSAWGGVLGAVMWVPGCWEPVPTRILWPVVGATLLSWALWRWSRPGGALSSRISGPAGQVAYPARAA